MYPGSGREARCTPLITFIPACRKPVQGISGTIRESISASFNEIFLYNYRKDWMTDQKHPFIVPEPEKTRGDELFSLLKTGTLNEGRVILVKRLNPDGER